MIAGESGLIDRMKNVPFQSWRVSLLCRHHRRAGGLATHGKRGHGQGFLDTGSRPV